MIKATCHPDKKHLARGLCAACYAKRPETKAKNAEFAKTEKGKRIRARWSSSPAGRASAKRRRLDRRYGLSLEQFEAMTKAQGGVCAICAQAQEAGKRLAVDHCHDSGRVRGLLCIPCNLVLGNAKDRADRLRAAAEYLDRWFAKAGK